MISDYFSLSFGNLRHRGLRSWLTILGIFIGIAAVVSLISLGAGLREAVTGQFGSIPADTLTIQNKGTGFGPPGSTVVEKLNDDDLEIIENIVGVKEVFVRFVRVVNVEYNGVSKFTYVYNTPHTQESIDGFYDVLGMEAAEGRLIKYGDSGVVMLGSGFVGEDNDRFEKPIMAGKKIKINEETFEVIGILEQMDSFQLNGMIVMPQEDIEELLDIENEYDLIIAIVEDKNDIEEITFKIQERLRQNRKEKRGEESFSVETPLQSLEAINTILNVINLIVIGIAAISLLVGGIGIANTMYTSVIERTKEIGIMKAVGAKNADILWIFLIESGLLGLVGGIVGALIGLGAAFGVAGLANQALGQDLFRISIDYILLIGSVVFSFVIGIVSGTLPALQASKLNVVDALRG